MHEEIKFEPGKVGALSEPKAEEFVHGAVGTATAQLPATVCPPVVALPASGWTVLIIVAPALLRTRIRISEGYNPAAVLNTRIVAPAAAENVEEVGPYPEQLKPLNTVTPLTETATVPPFQPSP